MNRMERAVSRLWGPLDESRRLHANPRFAEELASRCEGDLEVRETRVSKWSFGQQLEHLYLTSHYVLDRLYESMAAEQAAGHPSFLGHALMVGGYIPRGIFPTIPPLVPRSGTMEHIQPLQIKLADRLGQLEWDLDEIKASPGRSFHPRMKHLLAWQWVYFFDVHHRHHLRIMRDILKAAGTNRVPLPQTSETVR